MPYVTYTLGQLRTQLARAWDGSPFWTGEEARLAINESLRTWNLLVGAWRAGFHLLSVANSPYYTVPPGALVVIHVNWRGQPLDDGSLGDLDMGRPNWRLETIASGGDVPTTPQLWAPLGFTRFLIWPADTAATSLLALDAVVPAPVFDDDADRADINDADLETLLGFALRLAAFKKPGDRFRELQSREAAFYRAAADRNATFRASALYRQFLGQDRSRRYRPERVVSGTDPAATLALGPEPD